MGRISIAGLLGFVAVFAIGFAALVNATPVWVGVVFTLTIGLLLASVLAAILRGWRRGGWLGFALFGLGYFLLGYVSAIGLDSGPWLLSDAAAQWVSLKSNPEPVPSSTWTGFMAGAAPSTPKDTAYMAAKSLHEDRSKNATSIGRWLWVLLFAEVGAIVGVLLARGRRANEAALAPADRPEAESLPAAPHVT